MLNLLDWREIIDVAHVSSEETEMPQIWAALRGQHERVERVNSRRHLGADRLRI